MVSDTLVEVDVVYDVGALVAPITDHTLATEFDFYHLLELALTVGAILKLADFLQA